MRKTKLLISICISFILVIVFTFSDIQFLQTSNVEAAAAAPALTVKSKTLYVGGESYKITIKNLSSNAKITYKSSNTHIASVTSKGSIKPVTKGNAVITVMVKQNSKSYTLKITITVKAAKLTPTPSPKPVSEESGYITYQSIFSTSFENGSSGFTHRGSNTVTTTNSTAYTGEYSLYVSDRSQTWQGASKDMTGIFQIGHTYRITAWVKQVNVTPKLNIQCTIDKNNGHYSYVGSINAPRDVWTKLECNLYITDDTKNIVFYFEVPTSQTADFYIDDIDISDVTVDSAVLNNTPSLAQAFRDYFTIGAATSERVLYSALTKDFILHQFNTITMTSEMKPSYLLDHDTSISNLDRYNLSPAINTRKMEEYLQYAKDNGLKVRFHVLVWHEQTPRWFFAKDYSEDPNAPLVSKDVMLLRLENYIRQVMQAASKYPGVIYAWDVVNEAIVVEDKQPNGIRSNNNPWYQVVGEDYVEKAFEYARKYSYDNAPLFYNDFSTYVPNKRTAIYNLVKKLKDKGLIDGIGMQTHIDMNYPSVYDYEATIRKFAELNLQIQVTEMDMHNNQNTEEAYQRQARRYGDLFRVLVKLKKEGTANITAVTFWGVLDTDSWLTSFRGETSYPLLFDGNGKPKPAFYEVMKAADGEQ